MVAASLTIVTLAWTAGTAGAEDVFDRLGGRDVVRDQTGDGVEREPACVGDELAELRDVDGGELLDPIVPLRLVVGRETRGVLDEVGVVGAPDGVELRAGVGTE